VKVLVADDTALWRRALSDALAQWGYEAVCVEDGERAWQAIREDPGIAVLVTDWVMPGASGPELCRRVRALGRTRYLPIILLTSRGERDDLAQALEAGADAFVRKPFHPPELLAQLHVAERILSLEQRLEREIERVTGAMTRIEADLANAAEIVRRLLPERPPALPGLRLGWHHRACAHLGGDLFDVFRLGPDHAGLYVLDVSGHGTAAALHSVGLSRALCAAPEGDGVLLRRGRPVAPERVAAELDRRFPLLEQSGQFLTLFYGVLDLRSLRLDYVRAGHPGPVHVRAGAARFLDEGGGVPIGLGRRARWRGEQLALERGDLLLLFSDGAYETQDARGEEFGLERLTRAAGELAPLGAERGVEALRRRLDEFRGPAAARDDVTLLGLEVA
jgi:sigma-B regulation protein RsbU (phosphoserine phosphatase)